MSAERFDIPERKGKRSGHVTDDQKSALHKSINPLEVAEEETRQIVENLTGFITLLHRWDSEKLTVLPTTKKEK